MDSETFHKGVTQGVQFLQLGGWRKVQEVVLMSILEKNKFVIKLDDERSGAGYLWELIPDTTFEEVTKFSIVRNDKEEVGSPTTVYILIRPLTNEPFSVTCIQRRPFIENDEPLDTRAFYFNEGNSIH